ncbi:hypothetical protein QUF80_07250 [Desulfococcaceae bacterium HSG8]|nr:hypothetical protein [Desulfococcaceae bacterium HSG8]
MSRLYLLLLIIAAFCTHAYSQSEPAPRAAPGTVSMPWETFIHLRNQAKTPESQRSQRYSYENARYTGTAAIDKKDYVIRFQAAVVANTFGNHAALVPFLSRQLNLESLTVDGEQSAWTEKDGFFHALIPEAGRHTIEAGFTVILNAQTWPRNFYLPLVEIPGSEVMLHVPDTDTEARFDPGVALDTLHKEDGDMIRGYVPAVSGVNIRWLKRNEEKKEVPLKMSATIHTYISLEEKGANCQSEVTFRILQGETNFFRIRVPNAVDILEVSAPGDAGAISQWFTEDLEDSRMIHIYTAYQQNENFRFRFIYERTETRSDYQFSVPQLLPQSVERYENLIAVGSEVSVEISEADASHIERRDVRFLPRDIGQFAKSHALFYYKALSGDFRLGFNVRSHEKAPMVTTRIERVEADSVLTEAGTLMTKAAYYIKNNHAQFLRLKLPGNSKLLSAFLKGQEVQPVLDGEHLLIPISKSAEKAFPAEIAFLTNSEHFSISGSDSLRLPENELPIGELSWRLYTPTNYQMLYFGGNIERVKYSLLTRIGWLVSKAPGDHGNLAYAGAGKVSQSQNYEYSAKGLRKRFKKYKVSMDSSAGESGALNQIRVQIPVTGNRYRFESYLVKGFTPEITFFYISDTIRDALAFAICTVFFLFLIWTMAFILERPSLPPNLRKIRNYLKGTGVIAVLALLLMIFSLGINAYIGDSIALAFVSFALWQNRQVSRKFHARVTGKRSYLTEIVLIGLVLLIIPMLISDEWGAAGFVCFLSILFHALLMKLTGKISSFFKKRNAGEAAMIFLIFSSALLSVYCLQSPDAWAEESAPPDLPALKDTHLNLPWEMVEEMLRKIEARKQQQEEKPDADYIFGTVRITGNISKRFANIRFTVPLCILSEDYVKIPLFDTSVAITEAKFNGLSLALNREGANVYFEVRQETDALGVLEVNVIVPVTEKGGVSEFVVKTPMIRGGLAELTFGEDIRSVSLYGVVWQKIDGQSVTAALGRSQQLRGELATFIRKKETADETSKRVRKIYSTTYTLLSLEEEVATFYSSIRYKILNDQVREFAIRLPKEVVVHEIVGDDLEEWSARSEEGGFTTYQVKVLYPVAEKYDLSVQYEKLIKNEETEFTVPVLDVAGVARDVGYLGVEMQARAEIFLKQLSKARMIDIRELPDIIRADAYSPFVYAIRYVERPYEISFGIRKHKNFEMDAAIADRIQYACVISPRGKVLSQLQIWIRNSRKQFAAFTLPRNAKLVSTFMDGMSVKPSLGQNDELLLPLKRQSANPFVLDVVYEGPEISLRGAGGYIEMNFPQVDIPASIVAADIYVPHNMVFSEPSGDFQQTESVRFVPWRHGAGLSTESGITPEIYQREMDDAAPAEQQRMENRAPPVRMKPKKVGGTLSLKIELPKRGKVISMNTFYVPAGISLETGFLLCHEILYNSGYALAILMFMTAGYFIPFCRRLPGKKQVMAGIGFLAVAYLIPFSWKEILFYTLAGVVVRYIVSRIVKRDA